MFAALRAGIKPEPLHTVTQWADANRYLDSKSSAMPGRYRSSITPYLVEIMDNLSEYSEVEEVIFMKSAQIGATEAGLNWIGYSIDYSPCPFLFVEPTKDVMELVSKTRVQPMLESSPSLAAKVPPARSRDSGNTLTKKEYPGGILRMAGANSAAALRNMPVKRLMLDEVDAYPVDLDGEGNPIDLAKKRTSTFGSNRKVFILSTPTTEGISVIEPLFQTTDQRYYHVPCPHCGVMRPLEWKNLKYDYNKVAKVAFNVYYQCPDCNEQIFEREKTKMLANGRWMSTVSDYQNAKRVGYHLNALYSPLGWLSWATMAQDWEEAQGDVPKLKTFYNTALGLSYAESGEKPEWELLKERAEDYPLNKITTDDVAFLTCGVDVQKDRIELEIVGWHKGKRSRSIDYRVLTGYVSGDGTAPVWQKLAGLLQETWVKPNGVALKIRQMCVDSGSFTSEVYAFCGKKSNKGRVVPTKGKDNQTVIVASPKAVNVTRKNKSVDGVKVWHIGVSVVKEEFYGWLELQPNNDGTYPNGYCHLPRHGDEYFKGLVSEELITTKNKRGRKVKAWVKKYARNEPLDCRVYARAAAHMVGMDSWNDAQWDAALNAGQTIKKPTRPRESSFWD